LITYTDTSVLLKLLVDDEDGIEAAQRLWLDSDHVVCAEIGYVEARAALAAARRAGRLNDEELKTARVELDTLWPQVDRVPLTATLVATAGDTAEQNSLRAYDAIHLAAALQAGATVMATADNQLLAAAARNGLDTADPNSAPRGATS